MQNGSDHCNLAFTYYRRLARVRCFVEKNYTEPVTLEDAAAIAGLEPKYFSAYFRKKTGMCFSHWLSGYRVTQALKQMHAQDCTITEVAFDSGFQDLRTFERAFKNKCGTTPTQYKSKILTMIETE